MHKDIRQVREHYAALRDLIAQQLGGRDDVATRAQVSVLCEAAIATLDDGECRQRLRAVDRHAAELFSDDQHRKWDREHMSGAAYLRLQILIALEAVNTRLFFLEALRDRAPQWGPAPSAHPPFSASLRGPSGTQPARSGGMHIPSLKQGWNLTKGAVQAWSDDYAPSMGAALSYYTLFSVAPLLLIVISVAGMIFGEKAVQGEITGSLQYLMGEEGAKAIESLLLSVSEPKEGIVATLIGIFVLILGATTVFGELQNALDRIWRAPARKDASGLWRLLRSRLLSIGMILGMAFLLMVSLVLDAVLQAFGKMWGTGAFEAVGQAINMVVGFGITTTIFAMIYKLMPRAKIDWHDVWVGAIVTAVLFTLGKFLISLYIGRSAVASSFGAAGSLVVVMIWVYYSAQIFLLGAEFTWVYAHSHGSRQGEKRPGAPVDEMDQPKPMPAPARAVIAETAPVPAPMAFEMHQDPVPIHKRKPLYTFGAAAALGAIAAFLLRPETFAAIHRPRRKSFFN